MKCPACSAELRRSQYEGLPVFACDQCGGYLVSTNKAVGIGRRHETPTATLVQEASAGEGSDNADDLRCPRCNRAMKKEHWPGSKSFHIDKCHSCDLVWFDVGELAQMQLEQESTARGQDATRLQQRHEQMTPSERQQFEEDLARLPEGEASLASPIGQALWENWNELMLDLYRVKRR